MKYANQMNNWRVEELDPQASPDEEVGYEVFHWVGGEEPCYTYDVCMTYAEARAEADRLNAAGITFQHLNDKIQIDWNGAQK